jgi:hypothetical protein
MRAFPRTETVVIGEGMIAAIVMAVVIKATSKKSMTVRNFEGWEADVSPNYILQLPKTFPPAGEWKLTKQDKEREKEIDRPAKKYNLAEGLPVLLVMPVVVRSVEEEAVLVINAEEEFLTILPRHLHVLPTYFPFRVDRKQESIYTAPGSEFGWTCVCGNKNESRFYFCDIQGNELAPIEGSGWNGLRACEDCGRVFHQEKLIIIDQNTRPIFMYGDVPTEH